jgi:hypothetical protein
MGDGPSRQVDAYWFLRCVACSEASMTTQMRGFGTEDSCYEQAIHAFSGGFMHRGDACGLLTGAALAAGCEARRRFDDDDTASSAALAATVGLVGAFLERVGSADCRDMTGASFATIGGRLRYLRTGAARQCGRTLLDWSGQAHRIIDRSLTDSAGRAPVEGRANCAEETLRRCASSVGVPAADSVVVGGLAGGIGLLGNVCGALATGVFALGVARYRRPRRVRRDSRLRGSIEEMFGIRYRGPATELRRLVEERFGSALCVGIVGRRFEDEADHAAFIDGGGCEEVIATVAEWVDGRGRS